MQVHASDFRVQSQEQGGGSPSRAPSRKRSVTSFSGGSALPQAVRSYFEPRLGHSFSEVRVHTDRAAANSAAALGADAYTVGQHVAFASGQFAPGTEAGDRLLGHELVHTVQQRGAAVVAPADLDIAPADGAPERAARRAAEDALLGAPPALVGPPLARQTIQRAEAGTYISRGGDQDFADAAFRYYRHWGHPNIRRVDNLEQVVADLAGRGGGLDTYRIVSHANPDGLKLGFSSTASTSVLNREALALPGQGTFLRNLNRVRARTTSATHVEIRGCRIGQNTTWLDGFRVLMGSEGDRPRVSAPDLYQHYARPLAWTRATNSKSDRALDADIADPETGIERDFRLQTQVRRGDLFQVVLSESGTDFIRRYRLGARNIDLAALKRLNPEIRHWKALPLGTPIFLKARQVSAGTATSWEDIAGTYFGDRRRWPMVWRFNSHIDRADLRPSDRIFLQSAADRKAFQLMTAAPTRADIKAAIRGGQAVPATADTKAGVKPILRLDHGQRAAAIGRWLAAQHYDPRGRPAGVLARLFAGRKFRRAMHRLPISYLSRSLRLSEDPIFPDDPRFDAHIIRRP